MDPFEQKKSYILQEIASSKTDASPKGSIDVKCIPLMEVINSHPNMVSTSSCSGRVSVYLEGVKLGAQIGAKGHEGRWLFVTHDQEELGEWWTQVGLQFSKNIPGNFGGSASSGQGSEDVTRYILFKFEPFILHVKCRDADTAKQLYAVAMASGYRDSGIGSNNLVAVRTSIRLDVPIGELIADLKMLLYVSEEYLAVLTRLAHARFEENERKYQGLQRRIEQEMFVGKEKGIEKKETKEERRARKISEGMQRRDAVLLEKQAKREQKRQMEEEREKREIDKRESENKET